MSQDKDLELLSRILSGGDTSSSDTKSTDGGSGLKVLNEGALKKGHYSQDNGNDDNDND